MTSTSTELLPKGLTHLKKKMCLSHGLTPALLISTPHISQQHAARLLILRNATCDPDLQLDLNFLQPSGGETSGGRQDDFLSHMNSAQLRYLDSHLQRSSSLFKDKVHVATQQRADSRTESQIQESLQRAALSRQPTMDQFGQHTSGSTELHTHIKVRG